MVAPVSEAHKSLFVMVGDLSADRNVAKVIPNLKEAAPNLEIWGCGGPSMKAAGVEILHNCEDFTVIGLSEILKRLDFFVKLKEELVNKITERKPDAVLLVDMGTFNLKLAKEIRAKFPALPILYFTSPQVWGSRPGRIKTIAQTVTKMLVIFPFEVAIYKANNVPVRFVGHPLTKNLPAVEDMPSRQDFCAANHMDPEKPIIGVFAGSRRREIDNFMPVLLGAMKIMSDGQEAVQFAISMANEGLEEKIRANIKKAKLDDLVDNKLHLIGSQDNYNLISVADIVWAKSGTTTLEVTLFGKPMLVFYRGTWLEYLVFSLLKRVKFIGMPNLLAGFGLVPELLQLDCRAQQLVKYTNDLLIVPGLRADISRQLLTLRDQLGQGDYSVNLVEEILAVI